jgi:hypothetical protein
MLSSPHLLKADIIDKLYLNFRLRQDNLPHFAGARFCASERSAAQILEGACPVSSGGAGEGFLWIYYEAFIAILRVVPFEFIMIKVVSIGNRGIPPIQQISRPGR